MWWNGLHITTIDNTNSLLNLEKYSNLKKIATHIWLNEIPRFIYGGRNMALGNIRNCNVCFKGKKN